MSTRANIIVKGKSTKFYLYHHFDGYPAGLGSELKEFCELITKKGRFYSAADVATLLVKKGLTLKSKDSEHAMHDTGFDISEGLHSDIEYLYIMTIDPFHTQDDGISGRLYEVKGYSVRCRWDDNLEEINVVRHEAVDIPLNENDPYHVVLE